MASICTFNTKGSENLLGHRTLKRVPLNFKAPLHKIWKGYINPNPEPPTCSLCNGSGYNSATKQISDDFYDHEGFGNRWRYEYGINPNFQKASRPPWLIVGESRKWCDNITADEVQALVDADRLPDFTHEFTQENGWQPKRWSTNGFWCSNCKVSVPQLSLDHHSSHCTSCDMEMLLLSGDDKRLHFPSPEEVNHWNSHGMGHDAINRHILIQTRAKRLGVYGKCPKCKGKGITRLPRKLKKRNNSWKEQEPPTGTGYQLWDICSDGMPISPVFSTAEELADWCTKNATIFGSQKISREKWLAMFIGEEDLEGGSMLVGIGSYVGALAGAP